VSLSSWSEETKKKKKKKKKKISKKKSTESWRMPKQITSKLHFLLGYAHK
jgi:hypothetical protein